MHSFLLTRFGKLSRNHQITKPFLPYNSLIVKHTGASLSEYLHK